MSAGNTNPLGCAANPQSSNALPEEEDDFSAPWQSRATYLPPQQKPAAPMGRAVDERREEKKVTIRGLQIEARQRYRAIGML